MLGWISDTSEMKGEILVVSMKYHEISQTCHWVFFQRKYIVSSFDVEFH